MIANGLAWGRRVFSRGSVRDVLLFFATFTGVLYPLALAYRRYGPAAPFKFFANDAFYYLNITKRSWDVPFYTYDSVHPTNGFHPLWQWLLTSSLRYSGLRSASDEQLLFVYALCASLCACGIALLALVIARLTGSRAIALFGAVPGFYDLAMSRLSYSTVDSTESAPWSFANGMESGLSVFWFGVFAWLIFRPDALTRLRSLVILSCVLTLSTLSRLDDIFLLIAFLVAVAMTAGDVRELVRRVSLSALIPTLGVGLYLTHNFRTTGLLLPVSGSAKASSIALADNAVAVWQTLVPTLLWTGTHVFSWDAVAWRVLQLVVPLGVALVYLLFAVPAERPPPEERDRRCAVMILASYVVMKGAYNLVLVPLGYQGHWYFPVSISIANLLLSLAVARLLRSYRGPSARMRRLHPQVRIRAALCVRGLAVVCALFATLILLLSQGNNTRTFLSSRERSADCSLWAAARSRSALALRPPLTTSVPPSSDSRRKDVGCL